MRHTTRWLALPLLAALTMTACGSDKKTTSTSATPASAAPTTSAGAAATSAAPTTGAAATTSAGATTTAGGGSATNPLGSGTSKLVADATGVLKGVCPDTVVVQTDWYPESEHGAMYELMGPGYKAVKDTVRVSGPLTFEGKDTGVKLEIRAGGPAIGNQTTVAQMYQDDSILLAYVNTDDAVKGAKDFPTVSLLAPQAKSPLGIMWDADKHPDAKTMADIAKEVNKITVFGGSAYVDYLVEQGIAPQSEFDFNYQGDKILVTEGATTAHQGFATAEPYQYAHLSTGAINVAFQSLYDVGWQPYPEAIGIRKDKLDANRKCLALLIPMMQKAQIDYIKDHATADKVLIDANNTYATFWQYDQGIADFSAAEQVKLKIVDNETTSTFGDLEDPRVTDFITKASPVYAKQGVTVPAGLKSSDIVDNEFLDPSITFS